MQYRGMLCSLLHRLNKYEKNFFSFFFTASESQEKSRDDSIHSLQYSSINKGLITELNVFNMYRQYGLRTPKANEDTMLNYEFI